MTQYLNPVMRSGITPNEAGAIYVDRQVTPLTNPVIVPPGTSFAVGDQLQIGVIPAGAVLVPELSTLHFPILDSNGTPTAAGTIGTLGTTALLAGAQTFSAAVNLRGSALSYSAQPGAANTASLGSPDIDTPLFITFTGATATPELTGSIVLDLALRAFNPEFDPSDDPVWTG